MNPNQHPFICPRFQAFPCPETNRIAQPRPHLYQNFNPHLIAGTVTSRNCPTLHQLPVSHVRPYNSLLINNPVSNHECNSVYTKETPQCQLSNVYTLAGNYQCVYTNQSESNVPKMTSTPSDSSAITGSPMTTKKRNPPPPPPPRGASWLRRNATSTTTCLYPECSNSHASSQTACSNSFTPSVSNNVNGGPHRRASSTHLSSSSSTPCAPSITDVLLRLLIRHFLPAQHPNDVQQESLILERLMATVCGQKTTDGYTFVDANLAALGQRILPYLIRIIYTELLPGDRDSASNGLIDTNSDHLSAFTDQSNATAIMTASMESHQSFTEEDIDLDEDFGADAVLDVLEDCRQANDSTGPLEQLEALPSNISIKELKQAAIEAIQRLVPVCQADATLRERDIGIVRLLNTIHGYSTSCPQTHSQVHPPVAEVAALVRLSFYTEHRAAICDLGGMHALIGLLRVEQALASEAALPPDRWDTSLTLRRYVCMALTNLTYGVAANKALLCRRVANLEALLVQLESNNEELKQVSASVLRNLCWKTDSRSKQTLKHVDAPRRLTLAAMSSQKDSTLRTTLSALWNLSSHCSHNKRAICSVDGVFEFLLSTMNCDDLVERLVLVENSGGIFRNLSAVAAGRDDYRSILQQNDCYPILVRLLRNAPSLTVVVNVCGALWNLTAPPHCSATDLAELTRANILDLLQELSQSPHELIRSSSTAVLRNLLHPAHIQHSAESTPRYCHRNTSAQSGDHHHFANDGSDDDVDQIVPDRAYRRRASSRAQLRFGLLSVVLEAEDADEEQAAEESFDEGDEEDEVASDEDGDKDLCRNEGSFYANHEALETDVPSRALLNHVFEAPTPDAWKTSEGDEEQACIYAEEGTPFPPDSTKGSCHDLSSLPKSSENVSYDHPNALSPYVSNEALPIVYAVEGTPSQPGSGRVSSPQEPFRTTLLVEDSGDLPSPPPDVNRLISPLVSLRLDNCDSDGNLDFQLPPPPLAPQLFTVEQPASIHRAPPSPIASPPALSTTSLSDPSSVERVVNHNAETDAINRCALKSVHGFEPSSELEETLPPLCFSPDNCIDEVDEVRLAFAEEGTPQDAISLQDDPRTMFRPSDYAFNVATPPNCKCWSRSTSESKLVPDDVDDEDEQRNCHILQECIASAMPTSSSFTAVHPDPSVSLSFSIAACDQPIFTQEDCIQSFAVEDTPFATSTKTSSLSDLSVLDQKSLLVTTAECVQLPYLPVTSSCFPTQSNEIDRSSESLDQLTSSSSNSANGDTSSDLLSEVIQSAMPKSLRPTLAAEEITSTDCVRLYAMEGTPSEDTALSDSSSSSQNSDNYDLRCSIVTTSTATNSAVTPPAPPRRINSTLSNHRVSFCSATCAINRPRATVAPMPQVNRGFSPVTNESCNVSEFKKPQPSHHATTMSFADKDDVSSFSSLLSIESVGLEHSLLQECITSAMPHPKNTNASRKDSTNGIHPEVNNSNEILPVGGEKAFTGIPKFAGLSSVRSSSLANSRSSSPGLHSAPANLLTSSSKPHKSQNGPLHFLPNGSGDVSHGSVSIPRIDPPAPFSASFGKHDLATGCVVHRASSEVKEFPKANSRHVTNHTRQPELPKLVEDHLNSSTTQQLLEQGAQAVLDALQHDVRDTSTGRKNAPSSHINNPRDHTQSNLSLPRAGSVPPSISLPSASRSPAKTPLEAPSRLVSPTVQPQQIRPPKMLYSPIKSKPSSAIPTPSACVTRSGLKPPSLLPTRSSFTCPPSAATGRSLTSSRSNSTAGSQTNLHSRASKTPSVHSIYAALAKQERQTGLASRKSTLQEKVPRYGRTLKAPSSPNLQHGSLTNGSTPTQLPVNREQPKSIRGGRKSISYRKSTTALHSNPPATTTAAAAKPVIRPEKKTNSTPATNGNGLPVDLPSRLLPKMHHHVSADNQSTGMWIVRDQLSAANNLNCT